MSHPIPGHDYSEQTRHESNKEYNKRKGAAYNAKTKALEHAKVEPSGMKKHLRKMAEVAEKMKRHFGK